MMSHPVLTRKNAVCLLKLADILNDLRNLRRGDLWLCRHVTEGPVVLPYALLGGSVEGVVSMMSRIINVMNGCISPN